MKKVKDEHPRFLDYKENEKPGDGGANRRGPRKDRKGEASKDEEDDTGCDACPEVSNSNLNFKYPTFESVAAGPSSIGGSRRALGLDSGSTKGPIRLGRQLWASS